METYMKRGERITMVGCIVRMGRNRVIKNTFDNKPEEEEEDIQEGQYSDCWRMYKKCEKFKTGKN